MEPIEEVEMSDCKHKNWEMRGPCRIGYGWCKDCLREVNMVVLFDNLRIRLENTLRETEEFLKEKTK